MGGVLLGYLRLMTEKGRGKIELTEDWVMDLSVLISYPVCYV